MDTTDHHLNLPTSTSRVGCLIASFFYLISVYLSVLSDLFLYTNYIDLVEIVGNHNDREGRRDKGVLERQSSSGIPF